MSRECVNAHCASLPGAEWSDPWGGGHDCWKIGDKMFAVLGSQKQGVTLKCANADSAAMLIEVGQAEKAPYLPRGGWVLIRWGVMEEDELRQRLTTAYLTVRRGLTRKTQASLPPEPEQPD